MSAKGSRPPKNCGKQFTVGHCSLLTSLLGLWKGSETSICVYLLYLVSLCSPAKLRTRANQQALGSWLHVNSYKIFHNKSWQNERQKQHVVQKNWSYCRRTSCDYSRFVMQFDLLEKIEGRVDIAWGHEMGSRHNCHPRRLRWTVSVLSLQSLHCLWNPCVLAQFFKVQCQKAFEYIFEYFFTLSFQAFQGLQFPCLYLCKKLQNIIQKTIHPTRPRPSSDLVIPCHQSGT